MELYTALREIFNKFEIEKLTGMTLYNVLSDYCAFEKPALKILFKNMIEMGYFQKIYELTTQRPRERELKMDNIKQQLIDNGFQKIHVTYILDSISYGLQWTNTPPHTEKEREEANPLSSPSAKGTSQGCNPIGLDKSKKDRYGVKYSSDGSMLIRASSDLKLKSYKILEGTKSIGEEAFKGCSALSSIVIPASVTSIESFAFYGCSALSSIVISSSVTRIGSNAFNDCSSLFSIVIPSSVTSIESFTFYGCSALKSIVIPSSVTSIGYSAFEGCSALSSIVIPPSVTSIEDSAFYGCSSLSSIVIPSFVSNIGSFAFKCCKSLKSIVIPASVTSIGTRAFAYCSSLETIEFPSSKIKIGKSAFDGCSSLNRWIYYKSRLMNLIYKLTNL